MKVGCLFNLSNFCGFHSLFLCVYACTYVYVYILCICIKPKETDWRIHRRLQWVVIIMLVKLCYHHRSTIRITTTNYIVSVSSSLSFKPCFMNIPLRFHNVRLLSFSLLSKDLSCFHLFSPNLNIKHTYICFCIFRMLSPKYMGNHQQSKHSLHFLYID